MWTWTPLNLCFFSTTCTHALHTQGTLSNTLGHQFKRHQLSRQNNCDVCTDTIWSFADDCLICTRESLHPPLLSSPFYFLPPSLVLPSSSFLSFFFLISSFSFSLLFCFPSPQLTSPSSLTECQGTVHKECVDKLDKTCFEVSEGVWVGTEGI